jgi:hypothetical protein
MPAPAMIEVRLNPQWRPETAKKAQALINLAGEMCAEAARGLIEQSVPAGRIYHRGGGRVHQASAPGQPPAIDTGEFYANIATRGSGSGFGRVVAVGTWGPNDPAKVLSLEFGSKNMEPRPVWRPALELTKAAF